ncbi:MAG: TlpA family protein disulfide reductase [Clostridiales bacterium]|nr:TlpA family protein disulfide reductase [Clostridiales bacterium]
MNKKIIAIVIFLILILTLVSCSSLDEITPTVTQESQPTNTQESQPTSDNNLKQSLSESEQYLYDNMNDVEMRDFTLPDFNEELHTLSDYKGEIIVLNFWAIGCPPCVEELPDFEEVCKKEGVQLITVAQNTVLGNNKKESGDFISQFDSVALWDENKDTMSVYPSQYYPHTYIIDRKGIVRFAVNSMDYEQLNELVTFCDEILD